MKTTRNASITSANKPTHQKQGAWYWLFAEIVVTIVMAILLFSFAGRWDWGMGWALVILYAIWVVANALIVMPNSPTVLAERLTHRFSDHTWDNIILVFYGILTVGKLIVAGMDFHYNWTERLSMTLQLSAMAIAVMGYGLLTWAMSANPFYAVGARIQTNAGTQLPTDGPYYFVRHPGYVGTIIFELATPIMLGSLWALIPGGIAAILIVIRTAIEDHMLQTELPGYGDYAQKNSVSAAARRLVKRWPEVQKGVAGGNFYVVA